MTLSASDSRSIQPRMALARAFLAKAIYNMPTTEILIEGLNQVYPDTLDYSDFVATKD